MHHKFLYRESIPNKNLTKKKTRPSHSATSKKILKNLPNYFLSYIFKVTGVDNRIILNNVD